jgi:rRNA maturation endonuclease Nob1
MPVDPTDPETFEDEDATAAEFDVEAPEADAAEQHADLAPRRDEALTDADPDVADVADSAEQARVVELNEDDYS